MKKFLYILTTTSLSAIAVFEGCVRDHMKAVATINDEKISINEFKERYKKYLETSSTKDNILMRKRILDNMVNEKLIFQDISRRGLDHDDMSRRRMEEIRLQALMDRYMRSISVDTVRVSEQELWQEFRAYNSKVTARYLYAHTEEEARDLKEQLEQGATFESLAKEIFEDPGLANNGGNLGYFGWGEMEPALEEVAFTMPVGKISDPVHLRMGYAIVKVEDRIRNPLVSELDYAKVKEKLGHTLFHKKAERAVGAALDNIVEELSPQFDEETVRELYRNWHYLVDDNAGAPDENVAVLENLESMHLVRFQEDSWTVKTFLESVEMTTLRQRKRVRSEQDVKDMCTGLVARRILLDRARKAGFERDPAVLQQIARVHEEYFLKRWRNSVQDTVGRNGWDEAVLRDHFGRHRAQYQFPPTVNVGEILLRTEPEAEEIIRRLKRGEGFDRLAQKHSLRLWAAKRGGELGFGTEADYGILGKKFFSSTPGKMIGPERVDPYYGVFMILARREGRNKKFVEARDEVIQELSSLRKQEAFVEALGELRKRAAIATNDELLATIMMD